MGARHLVVERVVALDRRRVGEYEASRSEGERALDGRALEGAAGAEKYVAAYLVREGAALDVGGSNLHYYHVTLARGEDAMPFGREALHLAAVVEEDEMVSVVFDERVGLIDRDIEEGVSNLIGAAGPLLLGVGAGREEEEEKEEG